MVRYGDGAPSMHKANSSSCGRSKPAFMLSIGRCNGIKKRKMRVNSHSLRRKWFGSRH